MFDDSSDSGTTQCCYNLVFLSANDCLRLYSLGVFQLKEYFSVDNVLDGSDSESEVKNADGSTFIFIENINAGKSVTLENLQGKGFEM